jgi:hypothetical protein
MSTWPASWKSAPPPVIRKAPAVPPTEPRVWEVEVSSESWTSRKSLLIRAVLPLEVAVSSSSSR